MSYNLDGLKLIRHNAVRFEIADDPSLPFRIEINLSPPEFMQVAFVMACGGSEEIILRAKDRSAVELFLERNNVRTHPRLRWVKVTGPGGTIVDEIKPARSRDR